MISKKSNASFQRRTLITMAAKVQSMQESWEAQDPELLNQMSRLHLTIMKVIRTLEIKMAKIDGERAAREKKLKSEAKALQKRLFESQSTE